MSADDITWKALVHLLRASYFSRPLKIIVRSLFCRVKGNASQNKLFGSIRHICWDASATRYIVVIVFVTVFFLCLFS